MARASSASNMAMLPDTVPTIRATLEEEVILGEVETLEEETLEESFLEKRKTSLPVN